MSKPYTIKRFLLECEAVSAGMYGNSMRVRLTPDDCPDLVECRSILLAAREMLVDQAGEVPALDDDYLPEHGLVVRIDALLDRIYNEVTI